MTENKLFGDAGEPTSTRTKAQMPIDESIAKDIIETYEERGAFTLPVKKFNKLCGYDTEKLRVRQINSRLNDQYGNLLDDGMEFHIGTNASNYKIQIREVKVKEE